MSKFDTARPDATEHAPPFGNYIRLVPDGAIGAILESQVAEMNALLDGVLESDALVHHSPYTWSIKQVVGHITDCERVFGHRALRLARNDTTPLSGFDQDAWMLQVDFDRWPLADLVGEFELVRRSHLKMFQHLDPGAWQRRGVVINHPATARAFAYVMAGHARHHIDIMRTRLAKR